MKPCFQTSFGDKQGNCLSACIASLLELAIEDVPNFCVDYGDEHWQDATEEWLRKRGLALVSVQINEEVPPWDFYWMAGGKSRRGVYHSVIYRAGELVHDPHPSACGLNGDPTDGFVILPIDIGQWTFTSRRRNMPKIATLEYDQEDVAQLLDKAHDQAELMFDTSGVKIDTDQAVLQLEAIVDRDHLAELVEKYEPRAEGNTATVTYLGRPGMKVKLTKKPEEASDNGDTEEETAKDA